MTEKQRTDQQRKAIQVYCQMLADCLNAGGLDKRAVFDQMKAGVQIPWSMDSVKDDLWKPIQDAMLKKKSTTELEPAEVNKVYEVLNRWTGEKLGVTVDFPDRHGPMETP